jgi:hypothetical protein
LIENWSKKNNYGPPVLGSYVAYRKHHEIFVSWANGQFEYYDLNTDPYQLDNRYEQLTPSELQNYRKLVRCFRSEPIPPITTLDPVFRNRLQNRKLKIRGYAEDDGGIARTLVTVRSHTTNRYWNGQNWQNEWFGHWIEPKNADQPISLWTFSSRVQTETASGFDYLVFTYRSQDSDGVLPVGVSFHVNPIDGKSPTASFLDYGQHPQFGTVLTLRGSHVDGVELDGSLMTVRNVETGMYFNGNSFVTHRTTLAVDNLPGGDWKQDLILPPGRYIAGIRAQDAAGNLQHPSAVLRFQVSSHVTNSEPQ